MKHIVRDSILFVSFALFFCYQTVAKESDEPKTDIYFGPGIIESCKYISLHRAGAKLNDPADQVDWTQPGFVDVKVWLYDNIYDKLNQPLCSSEEPQYQLLLTNLQSHNLKDILLNVPMTKKILGPKCNAKIEELRKLMRSCRDSAPKKDK